MRTDVTIDKKQVPCPNASRIGYDKYKAQVGDVITYTERGQEHTARMIGRIVHAPSLGETPAIKGWILAIRINHELDHTCERWINPADVTRVQSLRDHRRVMEYFLSDDLTTAPIEEIRQSTSAGWSTLTAYREWKAKQAQDLKDYEARHPKGTCKCAFCEKFKLNGFASVSSEVTA